VDKKKLLIVGGGKLGRQILQILAPRNVFIFYVASRELDHAVRTCNLIRQGCLQMGVSCVLHPVALELGASQIDENAAVIARIRPDIILNCASLHSWRWLRDLPAPLYAALGKAQLGPWLPMHLAPAYDLMRAVVSSRVKALTVNAAYPDVVNVVLDKVGLAPDVGVGNIANLIPAMRLSIARLALCDSQQVQVKLAAQHSLSHQLARVGKPLQSHYRLAYRIDGKDCTGAFDDALIFNGVCTHFRSLDDQFLTATSAVSVVENLFSLNEAETHAPGPHGLPGGYPVRIGMGQVLLSLPYGVSRSDAISVNQQGQRQDGIREVHADGRVSFESEQMAIMESLLGYSIQCLHLTDVHACAAELGRKYQALVNQSRS
jgi:hypothetical protein